MYISLRIKAKNDDTNLRYTFCHIGRIDRTPFEITI